jgi:hypothetical protein
MGHRDEERVYPGPPAHHQRRHLDLSHLSGQRLSL